MPASKEDISEFMRSLQKIDISDIESVIFQSTSGVRFETENGIVKRIYVTITSKLGKSSFAPEELRASFEYAKERIESDSPQNQVDEIYAAIDAFVRDGGKIKIIRSKSCGAKMISVFAQAVLILTITAIAIWIGCGGGVLLYDMLGMSGGGILGGLGWWMFASLALGPIAFIWAIWKHEMLRDKLLFWLP